MILKGFGIDHVSEPLSTVHFTLTWCRKQNGCVKIRQKNNLVYRHIM